MLPTKLWLDYVSKIFICVMGVVSVWVIPWAMAISSSVTTNSVELRRVVDGFSTVTESLEDQEKLLYQTREDLLKAIPSTSRMDGIHGQVNIHSVSIERMERRIDVLEKNN